MLFLTYSNSTSFFCISTCTMPISTLVCAKRNFILATFLCYHVSDQAKSAQKCTNMHNLYRSYKPEKIKKKRKQNNTTTSPHTKNKQNNKKQQKLKQNNIHLVCFSFFGYVMNRTLHRLGDSPTTHPKKHTFKNPI